MIRCKQGFSNCVHRPFDYDAQVTLAQRVLVAIALLTLATTFAFGFSVREAWRQTEEDRFRLQFLEAFEEVKKELRADRDRLPAELAQHCAHNPLLDSALVGIRSGDLSERALGFSLHVPQLMQAIQVDELSLVTHRGQVLGAGHDKGLTGKRDPKLAELLPEISGAARVRRDGVLAVQAACMRRDSSRPQLWVGLLAARHLLPVIEKIGARHGINLVLGDDAPGSDLVVEATRLDDFGGLTLTASRSRTPLVRALIRLDWTILVLGVGTVMTALLVALLLAKGIARPIVLLSEQAREVVSGEPKPVAARGGKELVGLTNAFNQAIQDLTQLRKRLAATERIAARREIARRVAHEIKNPLAPIRTAMETLRRLRARNDPAFDEYFEEASRTVLEEVARISNIVTEFTRFARLPPPNPQPFDVVESVRGVVNLHRTDGVDLSFDADAVGELNADSDQIKQVVTNLLQNALDASAGEPSPRVGVELRRGPGQTLRLSVTDNGPGVPSELRSKLFEPYHTTKAKGTGLGLAIVQRIVVEHGGDIVYRDASAGGACFEVTLPIAGPALLVEPPSSMPGASPG